MNQTLRYRREIAELTEILTSLGIVPADIIRLLGVPAERFAQWQSKHPELRKALSAPSAEDRAEAALVKRALGFQISEATSEEVVDKKSGEIMEVLKRRTVTKEVPPDVRALLFYLKNRWPERWDDSAGSDHYQLEVPPEEAEL